MKCIRFILGLMLLAHSSLAAHYTNTPPNAEWPVGIAAGDTFHLVGTITNSLVIGSSGTPGNPITIQFEDGARFTRDHWADGVGNAAIYGTEKSHIVTLGRGVGTIEATNNGTDLGSQLNNYGIRFNASDNIVISGILTSNLYQRTPSSATDNNSFGCGVIFTGGFHDIEVNNCTNQTSATGIQLQYRIGDSNAVIRSNYCAGFVIGTVVGGETAGCTMTNLIVEANRYINDATFSGHADLHVNAMQIHCVQTGGSIRGVRVHRNFAWGDWGSSPTSWIFLEGYHDGAMIYNNVLQQTNSARPGGNGYVTLKQGLNAKIFNNTFIGPTPGVDVGYTAIGITSWADTETNCLATNNLFYWMSFPVYDAQVSAPVGGTFRAADYNALYPVASISWRAFAVGTKDWAAWTNAGMDLHSQIGSPTLNADWSPATNDTVLIGNGVSMSGFGISNDFAGVLRTNASWTIGAFEVGSTNTPPETPDTTPTPTFSPVSGTTFTNSLTLILTNTEPTALIFWTSSGTATTNSTLYTGILTLTNSATISAIAAAPGMVASAVASATFTLYTPPDPSLPSTNTAPAIRANNVIFR